MWSFREEEVCISVTVGTGLRMGGESWQSHEMNSRNMILESSIRVQISVYRVVHKLMYSV